MNPKKEFPYKPKIAAAIGATAAGKDVLANYLVVQHNAVAVEIGAFARMVAEGVDAHARYDASLRDLAEYEPEHIMSWLVSEIMTNGEPRGNALVITGVRTPAEAAVLKTQFGSDLLLAFVKVGSVKTRYERTQQRNFSTDPDDFPSFQQQDDQLKEAYVLEETAVLADTILWNNGSMEAFCQQIETQIVPHLFPEKQV